jgi:hypothetical protein
LYQLKSKIEITYTYVIDQTYVDLILKNSKVIKMDNIYLQKSLISSNDNCIYASNYEEIYVFSANMKLINIIETNEIYDLLIDDNDKILVSTYDKLYIYNLKENIIKS